MEMGRRRRQVKRKSRREGGGGHYSDYVDCPAGRCRLPSKAPRQFRQRGFVTSPLEVIYSIARGVPVHRRARRLLLAPCAHLAVAAPVALKWSGEASWLHRSRLRGVLEGW